MPATIISMFIFCSQANPFDIIKYDVIKDTDTKLETRTIGLHFLVPPLFVKGKLMVSSLLFFFRKYTSIFANLINFIMVVILFITVPTSLCLRNRFHFIKKKIYFVLQSGI